MLTKSFSDADIFLDRIQEFLPKLGHKPLSRIQVKILAYLISAITCSASMNMVLLSSVTLLCFSDYSYSRFMRKHLQKLFPVWYASIVGTIAQMKNNYRCFIIIDDTDLQHCKVLKKIWGWFKGKDKNTGGYANMQRIIVVVLAFKSIRIPVFFKFYRPDPKLSKWHRKKKINKKRKSKGKSINSIGPMPNRNKDKYPTIQEIMIQLLSKARKLIETTESILDIKIKIVSIVADAAYMSKALKIKINYLFPKIQYISQIKKNQLVKDKKDIFLSAEDYFSSKIPLKAEINIRGSVKTIEYISARIFVQSIGCKIHIVALRYDGEINYRYLSSTDLCWKAKDIISSYSARWAIEVVFSDLKQFCGLEKRACLQKAVGAHATVLLSMLTVVFLQSTPDQLQRLASGKPLLTNGSIARSQRTIALISTLNEVVNSPNPRQQINKIAEVLSATIDLRQSRGGLDDEVFFDLGPTKALTKRFSS